MGKMTPHEFLINIVGSTVLNIVPFPSAPIAPAGVLVRNFGYEIRLPKFGEIIRELMKKRGAKVPDLLLVNGAMKLLICVECKSDFTFEMEEKLSKQIEFYSSDEFKKIWKDMFPELDGLEIWAFCSRDLGEKIANFVRQQQKMKDLANTVVWEVELGKAREEARINKVYGNHLDNKLNAQMEGEGLVCSLPRIHLLIDPTLAYGERVFIIGRRILSFLASAYITDRERLITIDDFRERYPDADAIMTDAELKRCLRYLLKLIPEIGEINTTTGELLLAKRPSLDKIKRKLENIQEMTEEEIKIELAKIGKKGVKLGFKRPKPQKTKLDKWLQKRGRSMASSISSFVGNVEILDKSENFLLDIADNSATLLSPIV